MNKAFVREADSDVRHCPFCGSLGQAVGRVTLDAWGVLVAANILELKRSRLFLSR